MGKIFRNAAPVIIGIGLGLIAMITVVNVFHLR